VRLRECGTSTDSYFDCIRSTCGRLRRCGRFDCYVMGPTEREDSASFLGSMGSQTARWYGRLSIPAALSSDGPWTSVLDVFHRLSCLERAFEEDEVLLLRLTTLACKASHVDVITPSSFEAPMKVEGNPRSQTYVRIMHALALPASSNMILKLVGNCQLDRSHAYCREHADFVSRQMN
jgi:hypothetical protein